MNQEPPCVQAGFRKGGGTRDQTAKSVTDVDEFTEDHQECIGILRWRMRSKSGIKLWLENYFAFR